MDRGAHGTGGAPCGAGGRAPGVAADRSPATRRVGRSAAPRRRPDQDRAGRPGVARNARALGAGVRGGRGAESDTGERSPRRGVRVVLERKGGMSRSYGRAWGVAGEMPEVTVWATGGEITGLALARETDNSGAVISGNSCRLRWGREVRRTARVLEVPVGPALVG